MPVIKQDYSHQYRQCSSNGVQVILIQPQILLLNRHAHRLLAYADFQNSTGDYSYKWKKSNGHCTAPKLIELGFFFPKNNL